MTRLRANRCRPPPYHRQTLAGGIPTVRVTWSDVRCLIRRAMKNAVAEAGVTLLKLQLHHFRPGDGVTGVALLAESHISIHTWPERDYAAVDIFMCGKTSRPEKALAALRAALGPRKVRIRRFERGIDVVRDAHTSAAVLATPGRSERTRSLQLRRPPLPRALNSNVVSIQTLLHRQPAQLLRLAGSATDLHPHARTRRSGTSGMARIASRASRKRSFNKGLSDSVGASMIFSSSVPANATSQNTRK